ncbi:MAG TPA: IS481 family transposase [Thermoanaerobaculia bacterium]
MSWKEEDATGERAAFIKAYLTKRYRVADLCAVFGVSVKTGHKTINRFRQGGLPALANRSRASHTHPNATPEEVARLIIEVRHDHPRWGPLKVLQYLEAKYPDVKLPATSTAGDILAREGLVSKRRRRRPSIDPLKPQIGPITYPHQVNNIDFKGQFRTRDGRWCYPLTMTDTFSRSLLLCKALHGPTFADTKAALERCFREHGVPAAMRSDNGEPFISSRSLGGLSRLGVWLVKLGVHRHRSRLASPQDNAVHERMHRTLKEETTLPPARNLREQQKRFDSFTREYNEVRPHQSLDGKTPSSLYAPSPRPFPERLPTIEYERHVQVRSVRTDGTIKWKGEHVYVSQALSGNPVGLVETDVGIWTVMFASVIIGIFDESEGHIVG